eukprot:UN03988
MENKDKTTSYSDTVKRVQDDLSDFDDEESDELKPDKDLHKGEMEQLFKDEDDKGVTLSLHHR